MKEVVNALMREASKVVFRSKTDTGRMQAQDC